MFELNLVREQMLVDATRRKYISYIRIIDALCAAVALVLFIRVAMLWSSRSELLKHAAVLEEEIRKSGASYGIDGMNREWSGHVRTAVLVHELVNSRSSWARRLEKMSELLPEGIILANVSCGAGSNQPIVLEIFSLSRDSKGIETVDRFISSLGESRYFGKGIKLESHERRMVDGKETEFFRVSIPAKNS